MYMFFSPANSLTITYFAKKAMQFSAEVFLFLLFFVFSLACLTHCLILQCSLIGIGMECDHFSLSIRGLVIVL